jgi:polysaccharide biosynthesis/export protein
MKYYNRSSLWALSPSRAFASVLLAGLLVGGSLGATEQASSGQLASGQQTTAPKPPPPSEPAGQPAEAVGPMQPMQPAGPADPTASEWTMWRSGRYRITPGDIIELKFPFVPELDQTLAVQPDGYVTAREIGDIRVQGRTLPQVRADLLESYGKIVRDPVFTVILKEFEKPYFVIAGEITKPGRYDLRGATTLTQAVAYAGGPTPKAKMSEVVIFRYYSEDSVSVKQVNVQEMFDKKNMSEDPILKPGDTVYLSKSTLGKLSPILSRIGLGLYLNPFAFAP